MLMNLSPHFNKTYAKPNIILIFLHSLFRAEQVDNNYIFVLQVS